MCNALSCSLARLSTVADVWLQGEMKMPLPRSCTPRILVIFRSRATKLLIRPPIPARKLHFLHQNHFVLPIKLQLNRGIQPYSTQSTPPPPPADTKPTIYSIQDIVSLSRDPSPHRLIIDVREPGELATHGKVPGSVNMPITSQPDAFFLSEEDFAERFGFERPGVGDEGKGREAETQGNGVEEGERVKEVIFYCKAGVRSRAAARLAREWRGVRVGDMSRGFDGWKDGGGEGERG